MRPTTALHRIEQAQRQYIITRNMFSSDDFTRWQLEVELPDGECQWMYADQLIPPYCRRYPTTLGYVLSHIDADAVADIMDFHFPKPDLIDCDYVHVAIESITNTLNCGHLFSPKSQDGIDYYCGYEDETAMLHASLEGIDTSNHRELISPAVQQAKQWLVKAKDACLTIAKNPVLLNIENPILTETDPPITPDSSPLNAREMVAVDWLGSVADIAELFYRLARAGFIDLAAHRGGPDGNLLGLCRHVCQLLRLPPDRREKAAKSLNAYLSQFSYEQLTKGNFQGDVLSKVIERKTNSLNTVRLATALDKFEHRPD